MLRINDYWVFTPKWLILSPPARFREHCGRSNIKNVRVGGWHKTHHSYGDVHETCAMSSHQEQSLLQQVLSGLKDRKAGGRHSRGCLEKWASWGGYNQCIHVWCRQKLNKILKQFLWNRKTARPETAWQALLDFLATSAPMIYWPILFWGDGEGAPNILSL